MRREKEIHLDWLQSYMKLRMIDSEINDPT